MEEQQVDIQWVPFHPVYSSEVLVAQEGRLLGSLQVADGLRPESIQAVASIRAMGLYTVLLSGDATAVSRDVGLQLGVEAWIAELLRYQKMDQIRPLLAAGRKVAMVGDGINDAPALAQANVKVAMGSGTDVARESPDVLLLGDDLLKFVETLKIARHCRYIIRQNFAGTLLVDSVGVGLAAFGLLNPTFARLHSCVL